MYSRFNLTLNVLEAESFFTGCLEKHGLQEVYSSCENVDENSLRQILNEKIVQNDAIQAKEVMDEWFPRAHYDVFLSHSHKDEDLCHLIVRFLTNMGLTVFMDSMVWGYCNDLLKDIDNEYSYIEETGNYSYEIRNNSTAHVHMMLASALSEVLDNSECILFLNTPQSICYNELTKTNQTASPWIYHELVMTKLLRMNIPRRMERKLASITESKDESLKVMYDVSVDKMPCLFLDDFKSWYEAYQGTTDKIESALDILYMISKAKDDISR